MGSFNLNDILQEFIQRDPKSIVIDVLIEDRAAGEREKRQKELFTSDPLRSQTKVR